MKNIKYIVGAVLLLAGGSFMQSCTKLDVQPHSVIPENNFFTSPEQVEAAIAPAYNSLTNIPSNDVFQLNEVSTDEMVVPTRGNDWYDGGKWQSLWQHTFRNDYDIFDNAWKALNNGITKCNSAISILSKLAQKPDNADQKIVELKVLRAYYLYMLMDMYGNVPVVSSFDTPPDKIVTVPRKDVYAFLESELTTNVPLLTDVKDNTTYGHINRWGGYMTLAKLYLNAQVYTGTPQWQKAHDVADLVIKSGKYTLQPNVLDNFIVSNEGSTENIFVVPFDNINIPGNGIELNTLNYNNQYTYNLTGQPYNGFSGPRAFYLKFADNDARKKMWIVGQQYSSSGAALTDPATGLKVILSPYINELSNPADSFKFAGVRSVKYAPQPGTHGDTNNDGVLFRYADALMMKAEADMHLGDNAEALTLVNTIRNRSGLPNWTPAELTYENFLDERGREFAWEGWRRNDLIRFEVATSVKSFSAARVPGKVQDADTHTYIFPIPAPQRVSNPKLTQNPGYGN
ncbi:MAG: RagB/SusD family nutrient uptake outer membrane protein [Mucilaginibacter sp.]|uniref:RagB/SusD family nutrient uptake outer membrane protein n=1 Tax=Mucilaginibacter sp. TaxID=1882438 RepID=UPI0031A3C9F0